MFYPVEEVYCSNYIAHHLQRHPHGVTLRHDPLPPLVPGAGAVSQQRRAADDVLQSVLKLRSENGKGLL